MNLYTYVSNPNVNLLCCICRTPFVHPLTTRTCSHTFCRECIMTALSVAPQCPIDRSPLSPNDLIPADPLVRNLVDELEVECPNRPNGCQHTCQRQLLASHLEEACPFQEVPCKDGECEDLFPRRVSQHEAHAVTETCKKCGSSFPKLDLEAHRSSCTSVMDACEACGAEVASGKLKPHEDKCPDVVVPCIHEANGCAWKGPRYQVTTHILVCPYEAIKGFFAVHERKLTSLTEENAVLRHKLGALEGIVNSLRKELDTAKVALGPWFRSETIRQPTHRASPVQEGNRRESFHAMRPSYVNAPQPAASTSTMVDTLQNNISTNILAADTTDLADLASYFPPPEGTDRVREAAAATPNYATFAFSPSSLPSSPRLQNTAQPGAAPRMLPSLYTSYYQAPPFTQPTPISPQATSVAPLNLSTTLEGTLSGLRESIITLSASIDSLGRRQEVAVTTEAMRTAEEIRSLRAIVHGLRIQVHAMMMDHNAQVTGRVGDASSSAMGGWPLPETLELPPWLAAPYVPRHPSMVPAPPAITKL